MDYFCERTILLANFTTNIKIFNYEEDYSICVPIYLVF